MTAFARESATTEQGVLTVELRSVNHRYLDCSFRGPEAARAVEPKLREQLGKVLARGKVECLVRLQSQAGAAGTMTIDEDKLGQLLQAAQRVAAQLGSDATLDPLAVLQFPGIYSAPEQSEEALQQEVLALFSQTLAGLRKTREREGAKLADMVLDRLQQVEGHVQATRAILPELIAHQRDKVAARIAELDVEVDQGRLEQELVYMAQKADVDEELDRLEAHVEEVRRALKKGGPCGRRLDFLMQELNREANTLSSKSQSATTTLNAVELKVLIEQMREQIQNIE
ncbi:MAG: YicC/YloC family endoribonuclease [Halioglobus sp.]|nr:YicC/YloC family endoribonuclease [Halioglobus sp.]